MKTTPKLITQPADWWAAFQAQAKAEGMTLSAWIGKCCREHVQADLSQRPPAHRPKAAKND